MTGYNYTCTYNTYTYNGHSKIQCTEDRFSKEGNYCIKHKCEIYNCNRRILTDSTDRNTIILSSTCEKHLPTCIVCDTKVTKDSLFLPNLHKKCVCQEIRCTNPKIDKYHCSLHSKNESKDHDDENIPICLCNIM